MRLQRSLALVASAIVLVLAVTAGLAQDTRPSASVDPEINKPFAKPDVKALVERLETEKREVYNQREAIVDALDLKPGMAVADIGAGTGLFTRLLADRVGTGGRVYAVEVAEPLLKHIERQAKSRGQSQVKTVLGTQETTGLTPRSIDVAFLCDVYHHFEHPERTLASIRQALRPNGVLVVIELDRSKAQEGSFVKTHVRAEISTFVSEIKAAGFEPMAERIGPKLKENAFLRFRRLPDPKTSSAPGRD